MAQEWEDQCSIGSKRIWLGFTRDALGKSLMRRKGRTWTE